MRKGLAPKDELYKQELLLKQADIKPQDRSVVPPALLRQEITGHPAMAIELTDGTIITGKTSDLLGAASAAILNALKVYAGIDDSVKLISAQSLEPIQLLKTKYLGGHNPRLHSDEILIALSSSAAVNPTATLAIEQLHKLRGAEAHSTVILSQVDENMYRRLGINLTCSPYYEKDFS